MAIAESQGIESDLIPKIATSFCSGMARTSSQCGAVSGAMMGLGLLTGRSEGGASVDANYTAVRSLVEQFTDKFGSTNCRELTGCDLNTAEGQEKFRESGQSAHCLDYVEAATRLALSLGAEQRKDSQE